jgi:hypothetical protein
MNPSFHLTAFEFDLFHRLSVTQSTLSPNFSSVCSQSLRLFLRGLQKRKLQAVTLGELLAHAAKTENGKTRKKKALSISVGFSWHMLAYVGM